MANPYGTRRRRRRWRRWRGNKACGGTSMPTAPADGVPASVEVHEIFALWPSACAPPRGGPPERFRGVAPAPLAPPCARVRVPLGIVRGGCGSTGRRGWVLANLLVPRTIALVGPLWPVRPSQSSFGPALLCRLVEISGCPRELASRFATNLYLRGGRSWREPASYWPIPAVRIPYQQIVALMT